MIISKSLFVEFSNCPKLAWWHVHDKTTYAAINDAIYGAMDGVAVGQATEDLLLQYYANKQVVTLDMNKIDFSNWHASYHTLTQEIVKERPAVIYQGSFLFGDTFTKSDFLVLNKEGKYDLIEVKSKNAIRKKNKEAPLFDDLLHDISFQKYVLEVSLGDLFSGTCIFAYLNKEYTKLGDIDPEELLVFEEVTQECLSSETVEHGLQWMRTHLPMSQDEFQVTYPYEGQDYFLYFGQPKPKDSVWTIPRIGKRVMEFYPDKLHLEELDEQDILSLYSSKGEASAMSKYVELFQQDQTVVDVKAIQKIFQTQLSYPLYFYDYETVARPIPLFEGTHPRQQVIVQYSLHKVEADGTITHKEAIVAPGERTNQRVIDQLVADFEGGDGTYIVWYKGFENTRNMETALLYPQYENIFEKVNQNTFDLMDIFKGQLYFDRRFQGSASIKKVLPVLTDISYDGMEVPNGAVAMDLLRKLADGSLAAEASVEKVRSDLLAYCKQDSWAMVRIWQELTACCFFD